MYKKPNNIVVFDLDETLGFFYELSIFCNAIIKYFKRYLSEQEFIEIIDLFPEFLRPNIVKILDFVVKKKKSKKCSKIMIYTNNQGSKNWTQLICKYFDKKLKTKTFDQIIAAFKVNGEQIELCRTSHEKSVSDLIKCTKIPENARICFIDDQYHRLMENDQVYYINLKPYIFSLNFKEMALRYYENTSKISNKEEFTNHIISHMNNSNYNVKNKSKEEQNIDKIISKKVLSHLKDFFKNTENTKNRKTQKNKKKNKNKTHKLTI